MVKTKIFEAIVSAEILGIVANTEIPRTMEKTETHGTVVNSETCATCNMCSGNILQPLDMWVRFKA